MHGRLCYGGVAGLNSTYFDKLTIDVTVYVDSLHQHNVLDKLVVEDVHYQQRTYIAYI